MPSQPPSQLSRTLQYLYFMRFSLLLWLFPVFFAALDSGRVTLSTTTLSRESLFRNSPAATCA